MSMLNYDYIKKISLDELEDAYDSLWEIRTKFLKENFPMSYWWDKEGQYRWDWEYQRTLTWMEKCGPVRGNQTEQASEEYR